MNSTNLRVRIGFWYAAIMLFTAMAVPAQMNQQFAHAQQENALALKKYQWKARTEIQKEAETKRVQLALMRYDANGNVQKTVVSSTPEPDLPKFGLRKAIARKKLSEFRGRLEELGALARSYSELPPERLQRFAATATVTPEAAAQQKLIRLSGRDVLQPGDSMTVWVDAVSHKQRRVEIGTWLDGKPVRIVSEFRDIPKQGPTYMARSQVNYDGAQVVIITENFDYALAQL
ncbi:MAG TPA: hypothetical protein VK208_18865 [Pyrinomonadaceae bacterium]|nr:hypothetical protein [Pyrinomonadaceae bacterium]